MIPVLHFVAAELVPAEEEESARTTVGVLNAALW